MSDPIARGIRAAQTGLLVNAGLAVAKLVAGVVGHSFALVADAIESGADVFSSLVVWTGLRISARSADDAYPFGYGKAEALAAAIVGLALIGAAVGVAAQAVRGIVTPHRVPEPWTLGVLVAVVVVKEGLYRRTRRIGAAVGSTAVQADAWHHRGDAITSLAAFVGIAIAVVGGPRWAAADDWAALAASGVILASGITVLRPSVADLMDRAADPAVVERIGDAARAARDVRAIEKLAVRKHGLAYYVDIHVQADPAMSLHDAHVVSGRVKGAIRDAVPAVAGTLVHMEPFEDDAGAPARDAQSSSRKTS